MAFKLYDSNRDVIGNMTDVITTSDGEIFIALDTGYKFQFRANDISWDTVHNAHIKKNGSYNQDVLDNARYCARARAMYNAVYQKGARAAMNATTIKNVIFAPPATIVYWSDGTKTVVKCSLNDVFDPEKGLAMAIAKRCGGNKGNYYKKIQNWVEKSGKKYPGKPNSEKPPVKQSADYGALKKYISEANKDWDECLKACAQDNRTILFLKMTALTADLKLLENEINK